MERNHDNVVPYEEFLAAKLKFAPKLKHQEERPAAEILREEMLARFELSKVDSGTSSKWIEVETDKADCKKWRFSSENTEWEIGLSTEDFYLIKNSGAFFDKGEFIIIGKSIKFAGGLTTYCTMFCR